MRNIQEQEHMDFEMGAADESTNAYNHSKATIKVRQDGPKIDMFRRAGLFVAAAQYEVSCPVTDALIGISFVIRGAARTREAALRILGEPESEWAFVLEPFN